MAASACGIFKSTSKGTNTSASLGHINFRETIKLAEKDVLQVVNVVADGACMFRNVSLCVSGNEEDCHELRAVAVKRMSDHAAEFKKISFRGPDEDLLFDKYFDKIALPHQMVEYILSAITNVMNKPVKVYYY